MERDSIDSGDHSPVFLVIAMVNGSRPTLFDNTLGRYQVVVIGPDGKSATSLGGTGPVVGVAEPYNVPLPRRGVLMQRQDLRCIGDDGYTTDSLSVRDEGCLAKYALKARGLYRVFVDYFGPDHTSEASSSRLAVVPKLRLADTATFVVR
jgi:hypothetical protein